MKATASQSLDPTSIEILTDVMNAARSAPEGVDAVHYRAQHEDWLDLLDKLEWNGYLWKDNDRYVVGLCGLASLDHPTSKDILSCCEKIFVVLRHQYRSKPREVISVAQVAALAELPIQKTVECLRCMIGAPDIWQTHSNDFSDPEKAIVRAGERILKYQNFKEVVDQLLKWQALRESQSRMQPRGWPWPVDAVASSSLHRVDATQINESWQKALDRRSTDPSGAITAARSLIETVFKYILDEEKIPYADTDDLPKLYRLTAERLALMPDRKSAEVLRRILGGCQTVIVGLGNMRNQLSDAHGQNKAAVSPAPRHAELAVNLAGTIASFLIQTWDARKTP